MTPNEMASRVELWPLERLKPYARNPRTHSEEQVRKIAASIQEFGFTNPILVDGDAGIIAGHGRLAAARLLELDRVPVIELTQLTEDQKRAYRIADNRLALDAGWDEAILVGELEQLQAADFDLELTGFDGAELDELLEDQEKDPPDEDPKSRAVEFRGDRVIIRVSCYEADADAIEKAVRDATRGTRLAGIKITRA